VVNHVSQFADAAGLHQARMAAIMTVRTPAFIFVDDTDTFLGRQKIPWGLVFGAEKIESDGQEQAQAVEPKACSLAAHLYQPHLIHRAICNTVAARKVLQYLPHGEYYTEWLLYFFIAAWRGAERERGDFYLWKKQADGMHTKVGQAIQNTSLWLLKNHQRVLADLQK
jgi:hypothetical protein